MRKEFSTDKKNKKVKDAVINISGLGHYELTMNGEKMGESQFDPMWSDYDKTVYYNSFDVTDLLETDNAIGVLLGNGFYNQQGGRYVKMQISFGPPTLFFKMNITYDDGSVKEIVSDNSWKYSLSPIVFNDMYGGEDYDARLEQPGWDSFGFDDSHWTPVVIQDAPKGKLFPQTTYPIKVMETYSAQSVKRVNNSYVFDMGQNLSGLPRIKVKGKKGDKIRLTPGENVHEDGSVNQSQSGSPYYFEYTLKGGEEEIWQPRFSYYGYRYLQVDGAKPASDSDERDVPEIKDIESLFIYNSNPQVSTFNSSNEIFNNTHRLIVNAMKSNMHAVFTDCPHREKLGWLEQVHLNGPGLFYNFDLTTFAPKIMRDIRDSQLPNGLVPDIAPEYVIFEGGFRDSPEWGSTSVILPFMYYHFYGDNSLIVEYYDVMKRYVDYLTSTADNHIVSHGLGDWCDYREDQPYGVSHNTPVALSASTHYYMVIDYLVQAADITGNEEDKATYSKLRNEVRDAFNREFFNEEGRYYGTVSQASNAMPLFAGLVDPQNRVAVLNNLVKNIEERGFRLSTGDVGNRYLFQTLADNGLNEIMFKMHNHEEVPGYGFQLQFGATTLTELWDPRAGASWNHFMMGQIEEWFFKSLAGIRSEDNSGFKNIIIAPQPVGDLKFVEASYQTLYGKISVDWKNENGTFTLNVSVPVNCTAKIYLPNESQFKTVGSGKHTFTKEL
ncbi:MAG: glycoside hydrolase family 78 protein [Fermentimonas sp.]|nr:glycoside hydrolase family 78 protein [Fermentimonas sp.]